MNKYNWKEEWEEIKQSKRDILTKKEHISRSINDLENSLVTKIRMPNDASNIVYNGDLDEYFEKVNGCDISSNILNIMSDMYKEIKKLSNK